MLVDGRLLPYGTLLRSTVVVVGAGPAGLTVTQELAAAGIDVMLVEGGGRHHTKADDDHGRAQHRAVRQELSVDEHCYRPCAAAPNSDTPASVSRSDCT